MARLVIAGVRPAPGEIPFKGAGREKQLPGWEAQGQPPRCPRPTPAPRAWGGASQKHIPTNPVHGGHCGCRAPTGTPRSPGIPSARHPHPTSSLSAPGQGPQGGAGSCHQRGPGGFFGARGTAGGDSRSEGGGQLPAGIYLPRSARHRDPQPHGTVGASPAWGAGGGGHCHPQRFCYILGLVLKSLLAACGTPGAPWNDGCAVSATSLPARTGEAPGEGFALGE